MRRRNFVLALGSLAVSPAALAQTPQARIGVLTPVQRPAALPSVLKRLGDLGFVEGRNLTVVLRSTQGATEKFSPLARELIQAKPDLLIAYGAEPAAQALIQSTAVIPIVFLAIDYDPIEAGIVSSLSRPGKNVTGIYLPTPELVMKRLELLREILPRLSRILVLSDPYTNSQLKALRVAAERMRIEIVEAGFTTPPYDFQPGFENGRKARVEALFLPSSPVFFDQRAAIADLASANRLPSIVATPGWTRSGFLVSYGPDSSKVFVRAGDITASILKGRKPGEIPVEQVNVYDMAINLKVAKTLGLTIPDTVRLRADLVIE